MPTQQRCVASAVPRRVLLWVTVFTGGCLAEDFTPTRPDAGTATSSGGATACRVDQAVLAPACSGCHRPGGQAPDLTFGGLGALLDGRLVVPGNPAASLLRQVLTGDGPAGLLMPPGRALDAERVALVERWIAEGASLDCEPTDGGVGPTRYHPEGFAEPALHGAELELGLQDCRTCHGDDLAGGLAPACDGCHPPAWRTTCTFCHGGTLDGSGAPPRDLGGVADLAALTFRPHPEHVGGARHPAYDCTTCHLEPESATSPEHVFDATPGRAEVAFASGLSAAGRYEGKGRCSNLYCHGNGRTPGALAHGDPPRTCDDCHAGPAAGRDRWQTMSGEHEEHLREGLACADCHATTVGAASAVIGPDRHVDGRADVHFGGNPMTRSGGTCSGTCHGQLHTSERWVGN